MLGDPDRLARLARISPALANWGNHSRLGRIVMEKTLGIHRDKMLPEFASETFEQWFRKNEPPRTLAGAVLALVLAALAALIVPARQAASVSAMDAMRIE